MSKRIRCTKHSDQLFSMGTGGCPRCRVEQLEKTLKEKEEIRRLFEGERIRMVFGYSPYAAVFVNLLGMLGYREDNVARNPIRDEDEVLTVGSRTNRVFVFTVSKGFGEVFIKIMNATRKMAEEVGDRTAEIVIGRISSSITADMIRSFKLGKAKREAMGAVKEWLDVPVTGPEELLKSESIPPDERKTEHIFRVLRGGSWRIYPRSCRSALRGRGSPDLRNDNFGFRVLCVPRTPTVKKGRKGGKK